MTSPSKRVAGLTALEKELLVRVAAQLGPELDCIDVVANPSKVSVRELLLERVKDDGPSPTEVRVALMDLAARGLLNGADGDLRHPQSEVGLSLRGLMVARELSPGVGKPAAVITLRMRRGRKAAIFDARFETDDEERDDLLNRRGLALAAFYVIAVRRPTKDAPIVLSDCDPWFRRLAALGVGPRTGPGVRLSATSESITQAFDHLSALVELVRGRAADNKTLTWHLKGSLPEVRVVGATGGQFKDWTWMQVNLSNTLMGRPFPDARHNTVTPLTDAQLLEEERKEREAEDASAADTEGAAESA